MYAERLLALSRLCGSPQIVLYYSLVVFHNTASIRPQPECSQLNSDAKTNMYGIKEQSISFPKVNTYDECHYDTGVLIIIYFVPPPCQTYI